MSRRLGVSLRVTRVVFDPRFDHLVPDGTAITPHADGAIWAEGPVYVPDEDAVLWSDVRRNLVRRWSDADGDSVLFQPSDFANGHTLDHDGTVLACEHGTRRVARYERDGSRTTIVDRFGGGRFNSPNDIVVASDGSIWFTDPPYGILDDSEGYKADSEQDGCFVYRVDRASGEATVASRALIHPNGLAFSPDETVMYVSDTSIARPGGGNHHVVAFDVVDGRRLERPRVFTVMEPGVSDGFRVDVEGNVWTSAGDGIHVLDSGGVELGRIVLPEEASNCQFGGRDGQRLFITATSTLWSLPVGIRGAVTPWVDERG
jgi:gluconolactonase